MNLNCGSGNAARGTGEWRTVKHDAVVTVFSDFCREAGFRVIWAPGDLPGMEAGLKSDLRVLHFPRDGRDLELDVTCVSPYSATRQLRHQPDGLPVRAARAAERRKHSHYQPMDRSHADFTPLAYDVFGGAAPEAEEFLGQLAAFAVTKSSGLDEGRVFDIKYSATLARWKARLSSVIQREVANCVLIGAKYSRGGDQFGFEPDSSALEFALPWG